ncbi:tetratricopeptide repeat protein [Paracoccus sp. (in: a-proteobacteria)]|uniref:tetratricopeptide repeat protein n=1 Tax=Paracoccus sp. TaxID=267 RepID=UPI0026E0FFA4|nr:tetratricopeptide repeat protein [Paracoccus sp. (in: a-proteobacteria)]MDO5647179.1 tetratricopeptide repeat protein [Paracoccus sp. (in: a-proteobacteria)]
MANQNDSFIDEVTDELRRDRLYQTFRRWGWVGAVVILGIVGGASWREYSRAQDRAAAQAWGDAVIQAENANDPGQLLEVPHRGSSARQALAGLLAAGEWTAAGDDAAAVAALRGVTDSAPADSVLGDLALLKLVMTQGAAMDPSTRDMTLTQLSRPGAPFELLALEQKAVALIEADRPADAETLIRQIQQKDGLTANMRGRLADMLTAIGARPQPGDAAPAN